MPDAFFLSPSVQFIRLHVMKTNCVPFRLLVRTDGRTDRLRDRFLIFVSTWPPCCCAPGFLSAGGVVIFKKLYIISLNATLKYLWDWTIWRCSVTLAQADGAMINNNPLFSPVDGVSFFFCCHVSVTQKLVEWLIQKMLSQTSAFFQISAEMLSGKVVLLR